MLLVPEITLYRIKINDKAVHSNRWYASKPGRIFYAIKSLTKGGYRVSDLCFVPYVDCEVVERLKMPVDGNHSVNSVHEFLSKKAEN